MTALHQFGAEMLKLSRGLDAVSSMIVPESTNSSTTNNGNSINPELTMQQRPLLSPPPETLKLTRERNR